MSDLDFQQLSTVQSKVQQKPVTIASAAAISPETMLTRLTGTTTISTINPPVTGFHLLMFISNAATPFDATGNVSAALTLTANQPVFAFYDPNTQQYTLGELGI